jgi:CubicO group peptidase (beta-lactamase class C family)
MTAGLSWNEVQFFDPMIQAADWVQWVLDHPQMRTPGGAFQYSSGLVHVMSKLLEQVTGVAVDEYAREHLLEPLGIEAVQWGRDVQDTIFGASELFLTPRDMARLGQLMLDGGAIDGQQIVSSAWVDYCLSVLVPPHKIDDQRSYGAWWWHDPFPGWNIHYALGWGGQYIFLLPDLDLMVVLTSRWDEGQSTDYIQSIYDLLQDHLLPGVLP